MVSLAIIFRLCLLGVLLLFFNLEQGLATHDNATISHYREEAETNDLPENEQRNHPINKVYSNTKIESAKEFHGDDSSDLVLEVDEIKTEDEVQDDNAAKSQGSTQQIEIKYMTKLDDISDFLRDPMSNSKLQSPVLQSYLSFEPNVTFVLTLTYSERCPACQRMIDQFVNDIPQLWHNQQQKRDDGFLIPGLPPPVLILLTVDKQDAQNSLTGQLEGLGTTHVPSLLWMVRDTLGYTFVLDFVATKSSDKLTSKDILQKYQHLQTRLLWLSSSMTFEQGATSFTLQPKFFSVRIMNDDEIAGNATTASSMATWFAEHRHHVFGSVAQSLPGAFLQADCEYAKWLWQEDEETNDEGFLVLGQCRRPDDEANPLLKTFDRLAATWVNRRDILMVGITDCPNAEIDSGIVYVWRRFLSAKFSGQNLDFSWDAAEKVISVDQSMDTAGEDLKNALVVATTPSVLWLDRDLTAAIAFPRWRKVHAVLVIDIHRSGVSLSDGTALTPLDKRQANAFRRFRQMCRDHQRSRFPEDVVCLVVPSTDVRALTVFGIDIWTPLDLAAWKPADEHTELDILPVVFITDQHFGGTRRYYLQRDELEQPGGFAKFWKSFWEGRLTPFPKSSPSSRTNKAGVRIMTANDFQSHVLDRSGPTEDRKHTLVLFTSSMCGHCRRLVAIWNQLSRFVQKIDWSSFVELCQLDVSTDELLLDDYWNETIRWVPDLIYVSPEDSPRVVRYAEEDDYGDYIVGGIKSWMDLVDWFLRVASFDDDKLGELLLLVRELLQNQAAKGENL